MAEEEVAVEEVAQETTETAAEEVAPTKEADLTFSDSFIGSVENEELRTKLEGFNLGGKTADEFGKYLAELKSFTGKKGDIPKEGASDDEWNAFHTKLGRPDNVEGYDFELNDDFKTLVGEESLPYYEGIVNTIKAEAFKMGASNSMADSAVDALLSMVADQTEATNKALNEQNEANVTTLKTEFGDGYDAINDGIVAMLENNGMTAEQAEFFKSSGVLSEPSLMIPLSKIAASFADDPEIGHHQTSTQSGIDDQIAESTHEMSEYLRKGEPVPKHLKEKVNSLWAKKKFS